MPVENLLGEKVAEGKTKIVWSDKENGNNGYIYFKDDVTSGDGAKREVIEGSGRLNWEINRNIFDLVSREGVATAYIGSPEERYTHVVTLDMFKLEVVLRRIAAGSYLKRNPIVKKGGLFEELTLEFFYKDDKLHDPMLDPTHVTVLAEKTDAYLKIGDNAEVVFKILERTFAQQHIQLVDLKLEYGMDTEGNILLGDEINGGVFRVWPFKDPEATALAPVNVSPSSGMFNMMGQLNEEGRLDKDIFRKGEGGEKLLVGYQELAAVTGRF